MSYLSDTLTIGVLLVLLFGSISLYLYTRIQQAEQKIHLLESILLDLKMSAEIKSYTELPADDLNENVKVPSFQSFTTEKNTTYDAFEDAEDVTENAEDLTESAPVEYKSLDETTEQVGQEEQKDHTVITLVEHTLEDDVTPSVSQVSYDSMTLKELQTLAKSRGITGAGSMKKGPIMEALKTSDRITIVKPGSTGTGANSFLETSALVSDESS
jgi:hypothetical protein